MTKRLPIIFAGLLFLPTMALGADTAVSSLPAATTLSGAELMYGVQGGISKKITATQIKTFINPMTAGGDVIYGGSAGALTRLANGSAGQVLTSSGTTAAPTWTTPAAGGSLTATYVGYGSGANALTGTSDLTYVTATGTLALVKSVTDVARIAAQNTSTGTSAMGSVGAFNSTSAMQLFKTSTGYTTSGLIVADQGIVYNDSASTLFANFASSDFVWSRGGTAATNEVARLGAGTLSLGVAGTTSGSLALKGSTSGTATITVDAAVGTPTLTFGSATATFSGTVTDSKGDVRNLPQNSQSAAYTTVLADCGKHILHPSADTTARVFTIDSNANVAAPIGCMITFVNQNAGGVVTVAITSDTMRLAGPGTTGSRTMAANCVATALKIVSTEWIISGGSCLT